MRRLKLVSLVLICLFAVPSLASAQKRFGGKLVISYWPSWQWYDRGQLVNPTTTPWDRLSIINYAFFYPLADGTLSGTDSWADENLLLGTMNWQTGERNPDSLIALAHQAGVKVLLSVGGWTLSDNFPSVAASSSGRNRFATSCVETIRQYGFDGIDIDWEWPGFPEHSGTPADRGNFTLLLQTLRSALDSAGSQDNKDYLLTAFLPISQLRTGEIDFQAINPYLDYMNMQGYDMFGPWDPIANHNAPLHAPAQGDPTFNVAAAFDKYVNDFGIPPTKVNIGVPFYGRAFRDAGALFQPHGGADSSNWIEGAPQYYDIPPKLGGQYQELFDAQARVPYAVDGAGNLVSYDDVSSVGEKADFAIQVGAAGIFIWEVTGDFMADGTTPLLDAIVSRFGGGDPLAAPSGLQATASGSSQVSLIWSDNSSGEDGFRIERSSGGGFAEVALVGLGVESFADNTVQAATSYQYRVRAFSNGGPTSPFSNVASVTTPGGGGDPLAAPSGLVATANSGTQVSLTWTDNSAGEDGFSIERSSGGSFAQIGSVGSGGDSFTDNGAQAGTSYQYRVKAFSNDGPDSPFSSVASVTTPGGDPPPPPPSGDAWAPHVAYSVGDVVTFDGASYRCRQSHTSLPGWEPPIVPALWLLDG